MKTRCKHSFMLIATAVLSLIVSDSRAQSVLFDFDNAPLHTPLPIDITVGGITAHFSANPAYYNYSIQRADALGFTPPGFAGYCIYPNTVYLCDLLISFDHTLTAASILYAPEEYDTDSSCVMRITAYLGSTFVGTNTYQIPVPGTWPTGTLSFSSTQPFDNVVIHYDQPPPTGGDYGPIFMADNLLITPAATPVPLGAVSRKTHGAAGVFDVDLPLTGNPGIEDRTGGATNDYTMVVTFSGNVTVTGNPQAQVTMGTGCVGTGGVCMSGNNVTVNGTDVTIPLTNITNAQTINVRLNGVNSAADEPAIDIVIPMTVLIGDTNASGGVSSADIAQTKGRLGQTVTTANFRSDVNASGGINSSDVTLIKQHLP